MTKKIFYNKSLVLELAKYILDNKTRNNVNIVSIWVRQEVGNQHSHMNSR